MVDQKQWSQVSSTELHHNFLFKGTKNPLGSSQWNALYELTIDKIVSDRLYDYHQLPNDTKYYWLRIGHFIDWGDGKVSE